MLQLLLSLWLTAASFATAPAAHNLHVSYGRMAVEGKVAMCQIRFFRHDLEAALQAYYRDPALRMDVNPRVDSLYARYFNERFRIEQGGRVLKGAIVSSGEEEDMWWYTIKYEAPQPITALKMKHTMLFETFEDQRNIFKVKHFPSNGTQSLYFARGTDEYALSF